MRRPSGRRSTKSLTTRSPRPRKTMPSRNASSRTRSKSCKAKEPSIHPNNKNCSRRFKSLTSNASNWPRSWKSNGTNCNANAIGTSATRAAKQTKRSVKFRTRTNGGRSSYHRSRLCWSELSCSFHDDCVNAKALPRAGFANVRHLACIARTLRCSTLSSIFDNSIIRRHSMGRF